MPILKATAAEPNSDVRIAIVSLIHTTKKKVVRLTLNYQMSSSGQFLCPNIPSIKTVEALIDPWPGFATSTGFVAQVKRYSFTKLLNELFKIELQRRLVKEGSTITVLSMHPGLIATENSMTSSPTLIRPLLWIFGSTPASGATSALFATTAAVVKKEPEKYKAAYIGSWASLEPAAIQARDPRLAEELWVLTSEVVDRALTGNM